MANSNPQQDNRLTAFFADRTAACTALSKLKDAGFASQEIGLIEGPTADGANESEPNETSEGVWGRIKHFFSEDSSDQAGYRDSSAGSKWNKDREDYYYRGIAKGGALVSVAGARTEEATVIQIETVGWMLTCNIPLADSELISYPSCDSVAP